MINATLRKPYYGAAAPGQTIAVHVDPPIDVATETLVAAASRPTEVSFTVAKPDTVVVQSRSRWPVAWVFAVVPTNVVGPPEAFSDQWFTQARSRIESAINRILQRLRGG